MSSILDPQILRELEINFIHAAGPGGQNVNKVATAVQLRFDMAQTQSLEDEVKIRLKKLAGKRINSDGVLVIEAKRYRSQEKNRLDALARLSALLDKAAETPEKRVPTKPGPTAQAARLEKKKQHSEKKRRRSLDLSDLE